MKRFKLKPGIDTAFIPGAGRIDEGGVLMGEQFAKYVPGLLLEVPEEPNRVPLESTEPSRAPVLLTEPAPLPKPEPKTEAPESTSSRLEETEGAEKKKPGRPKVGTKTGG